MAKQVWSRTDMRTQARRGNPRWATAVALAAIAGATACGGGGTDGRSSEATVDESKPYLQSDGPLHPPVLAGVRPNGQPREPAPGFSTTDTEVNAFVALGDGVEENATLVVAWFRLTPGGREHLFSHEIEVEEHGRARSQALARTGLPRGIYETVATLGERQVRTLWGVVEGRASQQSSKAAGRTLQASTSEIERGAAGFSDSSSGSPAEPGPTSGRCRLELRRVEAGVELSVTMSWGGRCATIVIGATVTGPPQTLRSFSAPEAVNEIGTPQTYQKATGDLCEIPGGSDLPGTVVQGVTTDSGGASAAAQEVLDDRGPTLVAVLVSEPATGSRVRAGDRIKLLAGGIVEPPALGVKSLTVTAGGEPIETVGNASGSSEPRACDKGRFLADLVTEYVVPADPPPVVLICAKAVGFDGRVAEDCSRLPTQDLEIWEGTWEGSTVLPGCSPSDVPLHGTISFTVAADGSVSGTYQVAHETFTCGPEAQPNARFGGDFTGRQTDSGFALDVFKGTGFPPLQVTRDGDQASGEYTAGPQQGTIELDCVTCR
jgi:hypothetical protein